MKHSIYLQLPPPGGALKDSATDRCPADNGCRLLSIQKAVWTGLGQVFTTPSTYHYWTSGSFLIAAGEQYLNHSLVKHQQCLSFVKGLQYFQETELALPLPLQTVYVFSDLSSLSSGSSSRSGVPPLPLPTNQCIFCLPLLTNF